MLLPIAVSIAVLAVPSPAAAQDEAIGGAILFLALDAAVFLGSSVTAIGSATQLGKASPRLGWPIAGFVAGGLSLAFGGLFLVSVIGSGTDEPVLWSLAVAPVVSGSASIALATAAMVRRSQARAVEPIEEVEIEEDEWVIAPIWFETRDSRAPGVAAAVRF